MNIKFTSTLVSILLVMLSTFSNAIDCKLEYKKHLQSDLALSYKEFDQTMNSGMRVLGNAGCHKETADLIEAYIEKNNSTEDSLRWHVAQQRAMADDYPQAIISAKQVLLEKEDFSENPFRWNDYVLATIAFMEGDKEKLITHRNAVAKAKSEHFGNEMNLKLLDAFIEYFDKSYSYVASKL